MRAWPLVLVSMMLGASRGATQEPPEPAGEIVAPETPQRLTPPPKERAARDRWLKGSLDALVAARPELGAARVGIAVTDAATGKSLYGRDAGARLKIASNAKVLTAVAALAVLGPEYRYRTTLFADRLLPDGTIAGNLYLRGSGDPSLDTPSLWALVNELKLIGVKKVTGMLVVDDSFFDTEITPPVYDEKKEDAYFRAPVAAASLNDNAVTVWVQPGASAGAPARVTLDPASDYFMVHSTATTVATGRTALVVATTPAANGVAGTVVTVSGTVRLDDLGGEAVRKRIDHPTAFLGATARVMLAAAGIKIAGRGTRLGLVPKTARAIASRRSPPVGVLVREMSKSSNNFIAEALLKTMGAESAGPPGTWDKGVRAVKRRLTELGIPESSYDYKNGSGLYSSAFVSAETMTKVLIAAARDFRYGPDFIAALAIAGADGTLGNRMAGGPAERYVRGKSGSLKGVACLSGFAGGVGRPLLAFAVLVNDYPDTPTAARAARSLADEVAETLVRYVEAD